MKLVQVNLSDRYFCVNKKNDIFNFDGKLKNKKEL